MAVTNDNDITGAPSAGAADPLTLANYVEIGTSPYAASGEIRLPDTTQIRGRNAANDADLTMLSLNGSDVVHVGNLTGLTQVLGATTTIIGTSGIVLNNDVTSPGIASVSLGTNPASAGMLRLPNNNSIRFRNAANSADVTALAVSSGNQVQLGTSSFGTLVSGSGSTITLGASVSISPSTSLSATATAITLTSTTTSVSIASNTDITLSPTNDIILNRALIALGGGSAPTLGTIGGSGPATAGQNSWARFKDDGGNAFWVPVWK